MASLRFLKKISFGLEYSRNIAGSYPVFWWGLSVGISLYFGFISLLYSFSQYYIIQDDARQHIVWLQRFVDPQQFPNDVIANYYQSNAPLGVQWIYGFGVRLGIEPLILAKLLPTLLGAIATRYLFGFVLQIFPIPAGAFLSALIFTENYWLNDDLTSATARAFSYPLLAAFLYYLAKKSLIPCWIAIALQGLFYPPLLLLEIAVLTLRLFFWGGGIPQWSKDKKDYEFWIGGSAIAFAILLPMALHHSEFGELIGAAQMKVMPEYGLDGRTQYFGVHTIQFTFYGRSGLRFPFFPFVILGGLGFPFLLQSRWKPIKSLRPEVAILWQVTIASLGLFFLAHLLLFTLYFPSRYTYHTFRMVLAIAAGIVLLYVLDAGGQWLQQKLESGSPFTRKQLWKMRGITFFIAFALIPPFLPFISLPFQGWIEGQNPQIYQFLAQQPKDTLIASLTADNDNLPAFTQRSILVGREFALPFHLGYYDSIRERASDLIRLHYSMDLSETETIIAKYGIDFILLEKTAFFPDYLRDKEWLTHSSFKTVVFEAIARLEKGQTPALAQVSDRCTILARDNLILLNANCIAKAVLK